MTRHDIKNNNKNSRRLPSLIFCRCHITESPP